MQGWEYLKVFLDYQQERWSDNLSREGDLSAGPLGRYELAWHHSGDLLNDLGQQGWELVGVESYPYLFDGTTSGRGVSSGKWIFKRPSTE